MTAPFLRALRTGLSIGFFLLAGGAHAAAFTPGNIVVYRVGSGTGSLAATGNPVFLDEYSPAGALVQTIPMPTSASGANKPLIASGTATTDGLLTRSADGRCLVVPGYGRDIAITNTNLTTAAGIPRVVGLATAAGSVDTTTALTDAATGSNFRGAASTDCAAFWTSGATSGSSSGGVRSTTLGAISSTDLTGAALADTRAVAIYGGQLFTWNSTTGAKGIGPVGSATPTTGPLTVTRLAGMTDANSPNTYQFLFVDLDGVPGMDTLYIADAGAGALTKFSLVAGSWVAKGTIGVSSDVYRGLTGMATPCPVDPVTCPAGVRVTLFATRRTASAATPGGELVTITDLTGYNGAFSGVPTVIATAAANTVFRGVALAPAITITPSAGAHGSISPSTPQLVAGGATTSFTLSADAGYSAVVAGTCGGTLSGNTFTTLPASANCTVAATFTQIPTYTVTPSAGPHGSINPGTPLTLISGSSASFAIAPDAGYSFAVGGTCTGALTGNTFALDPVTADCTVTASFTLITRTVTPSAGANGTISPDSAQILPLGTTASFTVAAAFGYSASVGGTCGGTLAGATYTTNPVTVDCSVVAAFAPLPTYTVTPLASAHGTVTPNAAQSVMLGQTTSFTAIAAPGYNMAVRGTCGGSLAGDTFTTNPVTGDCTVVFAFARKLVLFVGNSFTHGRLDPVLSYNAANVSDLTFQMWLANPSGSSADEPHPWGGIPGIFKKLTDQAGLEYDVSISARSSATLRGHYLNSNPAGWDLRGNIASQRWDTVILQDLSDEPLPANRGANANLPYFNAYVDKIEAWVHGGAAETYTESLLFGGSAAACSAITGASANACDTVRNITPANAYARPGAEIILYETWALPDMIGPNGDDPDGQFYTAAEGLEAMTADFHAAYFGRAAANPNIADVSPVGDAFLRAVQDGVAMRDPYVPDAGKIDLWHTDFHHPSKYGSYLSALVHFATLTGLDPMTLGAGEQAAADLGIAPAVAVQLQRIARETVMPDATPPMTTARVSVPPNAQGWNQGSVTVTFAAVDNAGGWGVSLVSYTLAGAQSGASSVPPGGAVTIAAEGVTTLTYFATDLAGNAEAPHTLVIRIDSTAPTLSVPANFSVDATGPGGASVSYSVTAADSSGLAPALSCLPASGSTLAIGTNTISCTATDAAGNSAQASFNVAVSGVADQTARLVAAVLALRGINVSPAVTTLLTTYLQGALNSGHGPLFCAALTVFAKEVALLSGHGIPAAQAAPLVASANRIKAVEGCH